MAENKETYYAVKAGRKPGIYRSWKECLDQVLLLDIKLSPV